MHGAKGLEFPVVLLAGLSTQPPAFNPPVVWDATGNAEYRVGTKSARAETRGYEAALAAENRHDKAERLRLLYVAMTHARDHLVVSLHRKEGAQCHAASVAGALEATDPSRLDPDAPEPAAPRARTEAPVAEPQAYERWEREHTAALARAALPRSVAATAVAALGGDDTTEDDPGLAKEPPDALTPRWRRGRAGTAIGRAVHSVLQTIDLRTGAGIAATARAQAFAEGVADRADEVARLAEAAIRAPVVRGAIEGGHRWWREVPVAAEIDGTVLEGFVDLLIEHDDGLVVVDYKTDQVTDEAVDEALQHYAVQGAAYALALETALGHAVTRCVFVFAHGIGPARARRHRPRRGQGRGRPADGGHREGLNPGGLMRRGSASPCARCHRDTARSSARRRGSSSPRRHTSPDAGGPPSAASVRRRGVKKSR